MLDLRGSTVFSILFLSAATLASSSLMAEAADAGVLAWGRGGCASCHGNLAAGGEDPSYPQGPSLRVTILDRDQLVETISCGRPGTQMPANLKGAYVETACFGMPTGEFPKEVRPGGSLTTAEINDMVEFFMANVVGKRRITRQNCALFNDGNANAPECQQF